MFVAVFFHFDANPDPDTDPTPSFTQIENPGENQTFIHSSACFTLFCLSLQCHKCHGFQNLFWTVN
jgi:hypothetical protein